MIDITIIILIFSILVQCHSSRTLTVTPNRTFFDNAGWKRWAFKLVKTISFILLKTTIIFSASGFNQFGLYHDDALQETPEVKEALSRLPQVLPA